MKDSGIEWIGEIPDDWEVVRNKEIFKERKEKSLSEDDLDLLAVSEYYGVARKIDTVGDSDFLTRAESLEGYRICKKNDLAMNIMLAWKQAYGVSDYDGIVSPSYAVFSITNAFPKYYHHLLRTSQYSNLFKQYSTGIIDSRLRLYPNVFLSLYSHRPTVQEQQRIANFLDKKVAEIDHILEKTRESIEEYKKYKQSIITEAVTKGLNPDVKMKDSGIEWLGEIPEHWEVNRLKNIFSFRKGLTITKENLVESGIDVISYGQIHSKDNSGVEINDDLIRYVDESYLQTNSSCLVKNGDFIFADTSEDLDGCGNCVYVDIESTNNLFAGYHTIILSSLASTKNKYYGYLFKTDAWRSQIRKRVYGIKLFSITQKILKELTIIMPPIEEQQQITDFLDCKFTEIESLISQKEQLLSDLEAYKKSLIYECVTGKREVV